MLWKQPRLTWLEVSGDMLPGRQHLEDADLDALLRYADWLGAPQRRGTVEDIEKFRARVVKAIRRNQRAK